MQFYTTIYNGKVNLWVVTAEDAITEEGTVKFGKKVYTLAKRKDGSYVSGSEENSFLIATPAEKFDSPEQALAAAKANIKAAAVPF